MLYSRKFFLFALMSCVFLIYGLINEPLKNVHWDAPIYLEQAKRFSDTNYLQEYSENSEGLSPQVDGSWPHHRAFWHFLRLGNISILGSIVDVFGASESGIEVATWFYNLMMTFAMLVSVIWVKELALYFSLTNSPEKLFWPSIFSVGAFMLSPMYGYLIRSLVSEVPAILLISLSIWLFVIGQVKRSVFFSCLSGVAAFLIYFVRYESIITFVLFVLVFFFFQARDLEKRAWINGYVCMAGFAIVGYITYSYFFYPLTDPRVMLLFSSNVELTPKEITPIFNILSAGGLLWIAVSLCTLGGLRQKIVAIGFVWMLLAILPYLPNMLQGGTVQSRMFAPVVALPLILCSTVGFFCLFNNGFVKANRSLVASISLAAVLCSTFYDSLRELPVLWRIQYIGNFARTVLYPPNYEQPTYYFRELSQLSKIVYDGESQLLLKGGIGIAYGNLYLIRFFGADVVSKSYDETLQCDRISMPVNERVFYWSVSQCGEIKEDDLDKVELLDKLIFESNKRILIQDFPYQEGIKEITDNYVLKM